MSRRPSRATLAWLALLVVGFALTYPLTDYQLFQLSRVTTTALAVVSLVLLTGFSSQVSAGQGAAFGLGAYTCAVLVASHGVAWPFAVLAATAVAFVAGGALGLPALRLGPLNLALVTLTVAVLLPLVAARWDAVTGGSFGLTLPPVRTPAGIQLSGTQFLYLVTLFALAVAIAWARWWTSGPRGRALAALRANPLMARSQGIDTPRLKVTVVALSGALAGTGGALNALVLQSAIPDSYSFVFSLALLTAAVVGGIRSWAGAIAGAAFVVYVPQVASDVIGSTSGGQWAQVAYAATLLLTLYFAPNGLGGLGESLLRRLGRREEPPRSGRSCAPHPTSLPAPSAPTEHSAVPVEHRMESSA